MVGCYGGDHGEARSSGGKEVVGSDAVQEVGGGVTAWLEERHVELPHTEERGWCDTCQGGARKGETHYALPQGSLALEGEEGGWRRGEKEW